MKKKYKINVLDCEEHSEYRTAKITNIDRTKIGEYKIETDVGDSGYITQRGYKKGDNITYKIVKKVIDDYAISLIEH